MKPEHTEFRDDRFVAAFDFFGVGRRAARPAQSDGTRRTARRSARATVAYLVRAVTPGSFVHPAATVEDMYRPDRFARTASGRLEITAQGVTACSDAASSRHSAATPLPLAGRVGGEGPQTVDAGAAAWHPTPNPLPVKASGAGNRAERSARHRGGAAWRSSLTALLRRARRWHVAPWRSGSAWSRCRSPAPRPLSVTVLDRNDRLLRAYTTPDGRWRLPVEVKDVDPRYLAMLLAFEDKRFRRHRGVDPCALGRAGWQLVRHRRIVSGGSTLTMQVARLLQGEHERSGAGKIRQALRALQLERKLSKDAILRLYLRLAPFGGNLEGVRAASLAYFGKEPRRLSLAEAALLVALPQSPELRRPDRFPEAARRARNRVLAACRRARRRSRARRRHAPWRERMPTTRREFPMLAPHLADAEVEQNKTRLVHRLTIDARRAGQPRAARRASTQRARRAPVGRADRRRSRAPAR